MYIHNIYSDLMVALMLYIDKQLPIKVKTTVFNIGNVAFSLKKDTQYELPAAIVSLDSILPFIDHPYVFQFNQFHDNKHKQLAIYNHDKDFSVYLQEEYQTLNLTLVINCESQIQGFENQKSLISKLPMGKFMNFFKFTSFLELDRVLLNKYILDIGRDRIDNLFYKHNKVTNNTEYVFPMEYKPLMKMNSCDLIIDDINSTSYQINCNFEILFPAPTYQVYPCLNFLTDLTAFSELPTEIINYPNQNIPIGNSDITYVDMTNPYSNDNITVIHDSRLPVLIKIACNQTMLTEFSTIMSTLLINSDQSFNENLGIIRSGEIKSIGSVSGSIISKIRSFEGDVITTNSNIFSKITITENYITSAVSGNIIGAIDGTLSSIRIDGNIILAWAESNNGEIYFEIYKELCEQYVMGSIVSNMDGECNVITITPICNNNLYTNVPINKYSSTIHNVSFNTIVTSDIVLPLSDIIVFDPEVKTNLITHPIIDYIVDDFWNIQITSIIDDKPYIINGNINNNSGRIDITTIEIQPNNSLINHTFDDYFLDNGLITIRFCDKLITTNCELLPIPIINKYGIVFDTFTMDGIYLQSAVMSDTQVCITLYNPTLDHSGVMCISSEYVSIDDGKLKFKFNLQYDNTLYNATIWITIGDPLMLGKIDKWLLQESISELIQIGADVEFSNIKELASGFIERINVIIQEFDYNVLANFTLDDLYVLQHSNYYRFLLTDYGVNQSTDGWFLIDILMIDLYDHWDVSQLEWHIYFYRSDSGSTTHISSSPNIILDTQLSDNSKLVFRCSSTIFYQHFEFINKSNIAFLVIRR